MGTIAELIVELEPNLVQSKMKSSTLHINKKGTIWNITTHIIILEAIVKYTIEVGSKINEYD
jgi:hypothetical protein